MPNNTPSNQPPKHPPLPDVHFSVWADPDENRWKWRVTIYDPTLKARKTIASGFALQITNAFISAQTAFLKWKGDQQ